MTLQGEKLDRFLFKCADIIRNAVDKTDYKDYILPLVFYKITSDTYVDNYEEVLEKYEDEEIAKDPAFHDFQVPDGYLWDDFRSQTENIDQFINEAFNELEKTNPEKLRGVFRADFVAAEGLSDPILRTLIEHLSKHSLSMKEIDPDTLGDSYMKLVRHFAQEEGRDGGEFFTPSEIVRLIIEILDPKEKGASIYDPTCGSAGMLIEAANHFERNGGDSSTLRLFGQEINPAVYSIAKMNIFIHNLNGTIEREDTLRSPQFTTDSRLMQFDYVVANFPFSTKNWGKKELREDRFNRFTYGLPPGNRGDFAFIQHMISSLNETGKMGVVVPNGVLFRGRVERDIRRGILEDDLVEAVIGLPQNLFQNNAIPCAVLIINKNKPDERKGQVLFIYAEDDKLLESDIQIYEALPNQNKLTDEGVAKIVDTYREFRNESHHSRAVTLEEIKENDYNLNIPRYVDTIESEEPVDVNNAWTELKEATESRNEIELQLDNILEELGYEHS